MMGPPVVNPNRRLVALVGGVAAVLIVMRSVTSHLGFLAPDPMSSEEARIEAQFEGKGVWSSDGFPPEDDAELEMLEKMEFSPTTNASIKFELPTVKLDDDSPPFVRDAGIHIITTFFKGDEKLKRVVEMLRALKINLENEYVTAVHVLWEDVNPRQLLKNPDYLRRINSKEVESRRKTEFDERMLNKLVTSRIQKQPTYFRFFGYANVVLKRGSVAIVANSDIYFDKTLRFIKYAPPTAGEPDKRSAFALSRRHAPECGPLRDWKSTYDLCDHYIGSHDAFVFAPPVGARVLKNSKHTQNHFGAENIIVWAFLWAGPYRNNVSNPCQRIKGYHLHCATAQERSYKVGAFISKGRHGNIAPGLQRQENRWMNIY